jgi:hypothetical protein
LYGIPPSNIIDILKKTKLRSGTNEIIQKLTGFKHPLKIVAVVENDIITVVTSYPLKKGLAL